LASEIKILALRFRDLVTVPGETIRLHQKLISADPTPGYVWWGWWNKSGETVPGDVFRLMKERIRIDGSVPILLFDSGHLECRYADCTDIRWSPLYELQVTPEPDRTPSYYSHREYFAWFKFAKIHDPLKNPNEELRMFTYHQVDDFFTSKESRYGVFYGKQVHSTDELKQQDRTIWFLRAFKSGDPTHQISLLQSNLIQPHHFPLGYTTTDSRHLLWISDPHFGQNHAFPATTSEDKKDLGQALEDAAKDHKIRDFAGLIVSGDLTWKSAKGEYDAFRQFLSRICRSPSVIDNYRIALCPGNHDLAFTKTPAEKSAAINDKVAPDKARKNYAQLYEALFYVAPNEHLSMARRFLLGRHLPVEIVCLNSSLLQQKKGWFQGHGFIGDRQLVTIATSLNWEATEASEVPRPFRVLVMHHHLLPVVFAEDPMGGTQYSVVLDAERVAQWIAHNRINLVLHGHMHQPFSAQVVRPVNPLEPSGEQHRYWVVGLGSTGVRKEHRGEVPNMFGILTAFADRMRVSLFTVAPKEKSNSVWHIDVPLWADGQGNAR
jgi:3',5'-cyclic AMP phosphodiesterase CpdA